ncbi:unnamed protein product [Closterium sp. Yama58-4]|nr:unnamed protein product [Closterium sp. Yama58-4]
MLPTMGRVSRPGPVRQQSSLPQYLRRIVKWQQMDAEYCFWQMLHLCLTPRVVYQHTKYHKQTKNQWARDDPAFVVISAMLLAISASSYCVAYGHGIAQAGLTVFSVVVFDFLLIGAAIATLCWFVCNRYLRDSGGVASHAVEQKVEWLYAFDVHCNAYFPLFVLLYVVQYFLSPLLLAPGFIPLLLSNTLYLVAFSYYHYLNFLGYDVLPFLDKTTVLLYPMPLLLLLFPISLLSRFNPTQFALSYYFG